MISFISLLIVIVYISSFISGSQSFQFPGAGIGKWLSPSPTSLRSCSPCGCSSSSTTKEGNDPLKIIIAGAPASGKGTQCEVIKEQFGVVHLSTGDILRAAVKEGTSLGIQAKNYMDNGKLVPDELIIDVVSERLTQSDCQNKGWLLDGFPRTAKQASVLENKGFHPDCFILLDVPEEVLVERVTGRRTDPVTGKIYHLKFSPPENNEIASRLIQRSDDTEEKIKIRFKEFQSHITAIRSFYEKKMICINGTCSSKEVANQVIHGIQKKRIEKKGLLDQDHLVSLLADLLTLEKNLGNPEKLIEEFQKKISPVLHKYH